MAITFTKATKSKSKLRLALIGPTGSGKTWSALLLAKGLGDKIAIADTENNSAGLYADSIGFEYDTVVMEKPYTPEQYIEVIKAAEEADYDVLILDSLTHAWKEMLEQVDKISATSMNKNSFTAWRTVTPKHDLLIETILSSKIHIIATMRAKTEYVMEETVKNGKKIVAPRKVGLAPVFRDGVEYEFTTVLDIDSGNHAMASKDRTGIFKDQIDKITIKTGENLKRWLESGVDPKVEGALSKLIEDIRFEGSLDKALTERVEGAKKLLNKEQAKKLEIVLQEMKSKEGAAK